MLKSELFFSYIIYKMLRTFLRGARDALLLLLAATSANNYNQITEGLEMPWIITTDEQLMELRKQMSIPDKRMHFITKYNQIARKRRLSKELKRQTRQKNKYHGKSTGHRGVHQRLGSRNY